MNTDNDIVIVSTRDHYILEYNRISCKVLKPNNEHRHYIVCQNENSQSCSEIMYDTINLYCIEKNPSERKLNKKITEMIDKHKKPIIQSQIEDINIEYYKTKSNITKFVETSSSIVSGEGSGKAMFNKKNVADLLIEEFMECWKLAKTNKQFSIDLINNNIFSWKINLYFLSGRIAENLKQLKTVLGYNYVEINVHFHDVLYPNYPPSIRIIKPKFCDRLAHRIANSKMTQLSYWTPSRSIKYIIDRIRLIIEKWGIIDPEESINKEHHKAISQFEIYLDKFSSYIETINENDEIDENENFIKFYGQKINTDKKYVEKYWKQGTGFGHAKSQVWDPNDYIKLQKEKDNNISNVIKKMVISLHEVNSESSSFLQICKMIEKSLLIPFLIQQFKYTTLIEIQDRKETFNLYVSLLEVLATEKSIYLLEVDYNNNKLYDVLTILSKQLETSLKLNIDNQLFIEILNVFALLRSIYESIPKKEEPKTESKKTKQPKKLKEETKLDYVQILKPMRFAYSEIFKGGYKKEYIETFKKESVSNWKQCHHRLSAEIPTLMQENQLPIIETSSVFLRVDENNPNIMRALITGPKDTPYDGGCFIFDIYLSANYPKACPKMWFMNHGGKRFNPNLYDCGKVCLSILDTYVGPASSKSEEWNEKYSTILQVLVSIQAQILVDEPWFNEPGRESSINTSDGKNKSASYNRSIRLYTLKSTIFDLLENPKMYPQFEDVIINHFRLRKDYIKALCKKWLTDADDKTKQYKELTDGIIKLLDKLN